MRSASAAAAAAAAAATAAAATAAADDNAAAAVPSPPAAAAAAADDDDATTAATAAAADAAAAAAVDDADEVAGHDEDAYSKKCKTGLWRTARKMSEGWFRIDRTVPAGVNNGGLDGGNVQDGAVQYLVRRCRLKPAVPRVKSAWCQRLQLNCDELVSSSPLQSSLRH